MQEQNTKYSRQVQEQNTIHTPGRCKSRILYILQVGVGVGYNIIQVGEGVEYYTYFRYVQEQNTIYTPGRCRSRILYILEVGVQEQDTIYIIYIPGRCRSRILYILQVGVYEQDTIYIIYKGVGVEYYIYSMQVQEQNMTYTPGRCRSRLHTPGTYYGVQITYYLN